MQTIKQAAKEYVDNIGFGISTQSEYYEGYKTCLEIEGEEAFKAGVEFAQQWISIKDELPISGTQFLLKDENGNIYIGCYIEEIRAFRPYGVKGKAGGITHWRLININ